MIDANFALLVKQPPQQALEIERRIDQFRHNRVIFAGDAALQIDQELLSNLIVTARVGYGRDNYKGIDRKDERTTGYLGANYLLNRKVGFTLAYDYLKQDSAGAAAGNTFEDNKVSLSSSLQF